MPVVGLTVVLVIALVGAAAQAVLRRRERAAWLRERERLSDEIWELRAAAVARDKAEAASEAKSRFLAMVSHEVRTPLNGIIGMADLLGGTALSDEQRAYVAAVRMSGEALAALIDQILDFSRIESGRLDLAQEGFGLASVVEGVAELLGPRAQEKGLEIAARVDPDLPPSVLGDPSRLRQVLLNLAGNAIKFTEAGGVGVRVDRVPDGVRFSVSDTGPGVPFERREAIFAEFEQADNSTTRRHGGTGLGLAISRRIVAEMGGQLSYQPREPGGSVFAFTVPLPAAESADGAGLAWPRLTGARAFIASEAPFGADYLDDDLRGCGLAVSRSSPGQDCVAALRRLPGRLDWIFVDSGLGPKTVRDLVEAARRRGVGQIVLLLAPRERHGGGDLLSLGDGWLVKPVRAQSLIGRLQPASRDIVPIRGAKPFPAAAGAGAPRVLVAEDNPINALIAQRSLERHGASVVVASNGGDALRIAVEALDGAQDAFALILMDVEMPGLDGLEVTRRLRAEEVRRGSAPTRIVALTAHALHEHRSACQAAGMDDVLTKPVDARRLGDLIERSGPRLATA